MTSYYFAIRAIEPQSNKSRKKPILCGSYGSRNEAKINKSSFSTAEYERSDIYEAPTVEEARIIMENFSDADFNRL